MNRAARYAGGAIVAPRATARALVADDDKVPLAAVYVIGFAGLYSLTALGLYLRGWLPLSPPLPIDSHRWYLYQTLYTIPVAVAAVGLLVTIAHASVRGLGGRGSLPASLVVLGLGGVVPWVFFTWMPETLFAVTGHAPWPTWVDVTRQIVPAVWQLALCTVMLAVAHAVTWWKSGVAVLAGSIPFASLFAFTMR